MSEIRKRPGLVFWATAVVGVAALVSVLYGGAYLAMVRPDGFCVCGWDTVRPFVYWGPRGQRVQNEHRWIMFFSPAWKIDRRLRPSRWPPPRELVPGTAAAWEWPSAARTTR